MDRIVFKPGEVRGGGNIISPSKGLSDFQRYDCELSKNTETIDNTSMTVFGEYYLPGSYFIVDTIDWLPVDTTEFTINAYLKDNTGTVITGATVTCTVNNETVLSGTTDNTGNVSFTVTTEDYYIYTCRLEYEGTSSIAGCIKNVLVKIGEIDNVDLIGESPITTTDEDRWLLATVSGHDAEGGWINIPYTLVAFYEAIGYYRLLDKVTVPCESSGTNYCYSLDVDTLDLDLSQYDWIIDFYFKNTANGGRLCIGDSSSWTTGSGSGNNYLYMGTSTAGNGGYGTKYQGTTDNSSIGAVTPGTRLHYKIKRQGDTISYYLNGALRGTKTATWVNTIHTWSMYLQLWNNGETTIETLNLDLSPRLRVSPGIVESEDTETLTITLVDPIDGSRVVNTNVKIYADGLPDERPVPTLSLSSTSSLVDVGTSYTISGVLGNVASVTGKEIKLYENNVLIDTLVCASDGSFSKTITKSVTGSFGYQAVREETSTYQRGESNVVDVTVSEGTAIPDSISVTGDKSILSYYDSDDALLTATVLDSSDNPLSGQTVTMKVYQGSSLLETLTVIDNSDGTYSASYDSSGVGDISIVAECSNLQDTYSIEDCILGNVTVEYTGTSTSDTVYGLGHNTIADLSNIDFEMEWGFKQTRYGCDVCLGASSQFTVSPPKSNYRVFIGNSGSGYTRHGYRTTTTTNTGGSTSGEVSLNTVHTMKIVKQGTTFSYYFNGTLMGTKTVSFWSNYHMFGIHTVQWNKGTTTISNLKIKKI